MSGVQGMRGRTQTIGLLDKRSRIALRPLTDIRTSLLGTSLSRPKATLRIVCASRSSDIAASRLLHGVVRESIMYICIYVYYIPIYIYIYIFIYLFIVLFIHLYVYLGPEQRSASMGESSHPFLPSATPGESLRPATKSNSNYRM